MSIQFSTSGDFSKTYKFLDKIKNYNPESVLKRYAEEGVRALNNATPTDSGITANSWGYEIEITKGKQATINWTNSNRNKGVSIAILLQYGHGTRNGGYVVGRDFINPAMKPVFDKIASEAWKEVESI